MDSPDYSKGVMVALYPHPDKAKELALDDGGAETPSSLHVTLAFIGTRGEEGLPAQGEIPGLREACEAVSKRQAAQEAQVTGLAKFIQGENGTPYVGIIGSHTIHDFQSDLSDELKSRNVPVSDKYAFVPHMTFSYLNADEAAPDHLDLPVDLKFSHLVLKDGKEREEFPLQTPLKKTAVLYYRGEGMSTFHIDPEDHSEKTVCGQDLPEGGDIWVATPPRKHICPVCSTWLDREKLQDMRDDRAEVIQESKDNYVPPKTEDLHQPDHEYVGNMGSIDYYIAGCKCGWQSNIRSEQASNNAWQRHFDGHDDEGWMNKAGPPTPERFDRPPSKRFPREPGTFGHLASHGIGGPFAYDDDLEGLHNFLHEAAGVENEDLNQTQMEKLHEISNTISEIYGTEGGGCHEAAEWVENALKLPMESGAYHLSTEENPYGTETKFGYKFGDHSWNRLPDGSILDMTHRQFTKNSNPIQIWPPGHPMQDRYHAFCANHDCEICGDHDFNPSWHEGCGCPKDILKQHEAASQEYKDFDDLDDLSKKSLTKYYSGESGREMGYEGSLSDHANKYQYRLEHVPTEEMKQRVLAQDLNYEGLSWDTYHGDFTKGITLPKYDERWPVIRFEGGNLYEDNYLEDGHHRFHSYVDAGDESIPVLHARVRGKTAAWMDQVTSPVDHNAQPVQEEENDAPELPPLYQGDYGIWPDDQVAQIQKKVPRPAELMSNPKTGWRNV